MKPRDYLEKVKENLSLRDEYMQLMPLDLAWKGICSCNYQAVVDLLKGILSANNRVTKSINLGILRKMCHNFTNIELPAELEKISNTLTTWSFCIGIPEFDKEAFFRAQEVIDSLTDILKKEIYRTGSVSEKLEYIIDREYVERCKKWKEMKPEDLIYISDVITEARFIKDHILKSVTEEEAAYLIQFKSPLEMLIDKIESISYSNSLSFKDQFRKLISEMYDKQDEYIDYELSDDKSIQL